LEKEPEMNWNGIPFWILALVLVSLLGGMISRAVREASDKLARAIEHGAEQASKNIVHEVKVCTEEIIKATRLWDINEHAYVYDLIKASTEENKLRALRGINDHAYVYDLIKGISEEMLTEMRRR
jgi:hypothetical protein